MENIVSRDTSTIVTTNDTSSIVTLELDKVVSIQETVHDTIAVENGYNVVVEVTSTNTVLASGGQGPQGIPGINEEDNVYSKRIDFISDNELYKGEAAVGALESASVWRIRKVLIAVDSDVSETWAGGTANFDKIWADRTSLSYS